MLSAPATIERMIRRTGGLPVVVDGHSTWGHRLTRYIEVSDGGALAKTAAVKISTAFVPENPDNKTVEMDGTDFKIRSVESDEDDGAMSVLLLRKT